MSKLMLALAIACASTGLSTARADDEPDWLSDTVEERRHFDGRLFQLGGGAGTAVGTGSFFGLIAFYGEANVWDRLALGAGGGLGFGGPEASGYVRFRPIVWGGEGQRVLNAFTLRAEYMVLRQSKEGFSLCDNDCSTRFVDRTAQLGTLSAGFEHQLSLGLTIRYDFGFGHVFSATPWQCELGGKPSPCGSSPPSDDLMVTYLSVSHAL